MINDKSITHYSNDVFKSSEPNILKILVISDTHGFVNPDIAKLTPQYDVLIHAGDIIEEEALAQLNFSGKFIAVSGNNDSHLPHLDRVAVLDLFGKKLVVEHGHIHGHYKPCHHSLRQTYPDAQAIIYGHTHIQVVDKSQTPWIINPGAAGKTRTNGGASCLSLTISPHKPWQIESLRFEDK